MDDDRTPPRRDIGLSFLIPSAILAVVIWRLALFFGDRFNLAQQAALLFRALPDIGVLMLVGTVPDYAQGLIKLWWRLRSRHRHGTPAIAGSGDNLVPAPVATLFRQVEKIADAGSSR